MIKQKEEGNNMKQNVHDSDLKYQDFLILAYFKANYKKYEFNENEKIKILLSRKKELKACYGISRHIEGLKKHKSIHAAGVIISSVDLDTVIPLDKNNNMYITGRSAATRSVLVFNSCI